MSKEQEEQEQEKKDDVNVIQSNPKPIIDIVEFVNSSPPAETIVLSSSEESTKNYNIPSVTATLLVDCRCLLGECVLYDDITNTICFISILQKTFHRLKLDDDNDALLETYHLPKMIGAFALLENEEEEDNGHNNNNDHYLVAWEDGFQLYNLIENKPLTEMSIGEIVNPGGLPERLNDGRCDPTGTKFICGGHVASNPGPMKVYKCEYNKSTQKLKHTPIVNEIYTTNSICFSSQQPDGQTIMYLADSPTKQIHQYDYNLELGTVHNKRLFHNKLTGFADGSVVDSDGFVWNATWRQGEGTGMVDRIDPSTGRVVFQVHLPDNTSEASCCCFGGPNLDILFITTAYENLDPKTEPNAGGLYAVKLPKGMKGLKEKRFRI